MTRLMATATRDGLDPATLTAPDCLVEIQHLYRRLNRIVCTERPNAGRTPRDAASTAYLALETEIAALSRRYLALTEAEADPPPTPHPRPPRSTGRPRAWTPSTLTLTHPRGHGFR